MSMDAQALRCCCGVVEIGTFGFLELYDKENSRYNLETIEAFEERFAKILKDRIGGTAFVMATLKVGSQADTFGPLLLRYGFKLIDTELNGNSGNRVNVYLVKRREIKWNEGVLAKIAAKVKDMWPKPSQSQPVVDAPTQVSNIDYQRALEEQYRVMVRSYGARDAAGTAGQIQSRD